MRDAVFSQHGYRCRLDWGRAGASEAAARGDVVVIVDVLRFSTCIATAVAHGITVYPCAFEADAAVLAQSVGGIAARRSFDAASGYTLSPSTYARGTAGDRVALPSLNGAECSVAVAKAPHAFAGALVNASAVAVAVADLLDTTALGITVIACGERWQPPRGDESLRFAIEDYLGAGAILAAIRRDLSPEAQVSASAFEVNRGRLDEMLWDCASGRELRAKGLDGDVRDCAQIDVYDVAPVLRDRRYDAPLA